MARLSKLLAMAALCWLGGCSGSEIAALENVRAARMAERQSLAERAERLDETRARLDRAKRDLARVSLWRSDGDPAARMSTLASRLGGARASYQRDGTDWRITISGAGGAPAAMAALGRIQGPGFVVTRIDAGASAWSAELRTRNVEEADAVAGVPPTPARPPLPPPGRVPSPRRDVLRAEIEKLDHEIAELERLVGEAAKLDALQTKIDRELAALEEDPTRLGRVLGAVQPLFAGRAPLLASGTIEVSATGYSARGVAATGVTGETFATRKPEGWELRKLEGTSIELAFPVR